MRQMSEGKREREREGRWGRERRKVQAELVQGRARERE